MMSRSNTHHAVRGPVAVLLALWISVAAGSVSRSADVVLKAKPLAIPILTAPSQSISCVVFRNALPPVSAVALGPDGRMLAAAGYREVVVWDLENARLLGRIGSGQLGTSIGALVFLQGAQRLAIGEGTPGRAGAVRIFDVGSGQQVCAFEDLSDVVYALAPSPDGKLLAGGGADGTTRVWSVDGRKLVTTVGEQGRPILGVSFSSDGKLLATAGADSTARIWEVGAWNLATQMSEIDALQGVAFSGDGKLLALAVGGREFRGVRILRIDNGRPTRTVMTGGGLPLDVVWLARGNAIYVPCSDHTVKAYNPANGRLERTFTGHADWIYKVALNADRTMLASGSADGTVRLWSTADARLLATFVQLTPGADDWLVLTREGYLAHSKSAAFEWKTSGVEVPQEKLTSILEKPEIVRQAVAGKKVNAPGIQ